MKKGEALVDSSTSARTKAEAAEKDEGLESRVVSGSRVKLETGAAEVQRGTDKSSNKGGGDRKTTAAEEEEDPDPFFEPVIQLPLVETKTLEEDEDVLWESPRARLYRFAEGYDAAEWKERGTGILKLLKHKSTGTVRLVMRREQTLKVCANHLLLPDMELRPHEQQRNVWLWTTHADVADGQPSHQVFAIRFKTEEVAQEFRYRFNEEKMKVAEKEADLTAKLGDVSLSEAN